MHFKTDQVTSRNSNSILQAVTNTSKKDTNKDKEIISELSECSNITSSATLNSHDSTFTFPKKGHIRLVKNWLRRSYSLELYYANKHVASFDIKYDDEFAFKRESLIISMKKKSAGELVRLGFEKKNSVEAEAYKNLEANLSLIKEETDDNFMCTVFNYSNKNLNSSNKSSSNQKQTCLTPQTPTTNQPIKQEVKMDTCSIKNDLLKQYETNTTTQHQFLVQQQQQKLNSISSTFYTSNSNKQTSAVPQISNIHRLHITENVLNSLSSTTNNINNNGSKSPVVVRRQPLGALSSPNLNKRKRDDLEFKLTSPNKNNQSNPAAAASVSTAKKALYDTRNKTLFDFEDQENKAVTTMRFGMSSPIKTWNRNNSMNGKQCGKGFSNLGNTCYMNAILQCLLNIEMFSDELMRVNKCKLNSKPNSLLLTEATSQLERSILKKDETCDLVVSGGGADDTCLFETTSSVVNNEEKSLFQCMCELLKAREQHNDMQQIRSLKEIKNAISKEATIFSGYQQHDAHEFLCQVLDQLKDDIDKLNKTKQGPLKSEQSTLKETTKEATSINVKLNESYSNPVVDNFQFEVQHIIHCLKCNHEQSSIEEYNNLCLEMPLKPNKNMSLQDTLDIFFKDEYLNDFKCDNCKTIEQVVIKRKFKKIPRILILHLKRYQFQETNQPSDTNDSSDKQFKLIKNDSDIKIPLFLSLETVLNSDHKKERSPASPPQTISNKKSPKNLQETLNSRLNLSANFKIPKKAEIKKAVDDDYEFDLPDLFLDQNSRFIPPNLSEEEQMKKALELSLVETNNQKLMFVDGNYFEENQEDDTEKDKTYVFKRSELKTYESKFKKPLAQINNIENSNNKKANASRIKFKQQQTNDDMLDLLNEEADEDEEMKRAIAESLKFAKQQNKRTESIEDPFLSVLIKDYHHQVAPTSQSAEKEHKTSPISVKTESHSSTNSKIQTNKKSDANSYRIIGIVNHLGVSSNSGHYICDVYNLKSKQWSSYDDTKVELISEEEVLDKRSNTGYIFFYIKSSLESNK